MSEINANFAQLHKAYWDRDKNSGIGKIHHPNIGIVGFLFENGLVIGHLNFFDSQSIKYYRAEFAKNNYQLSPGYQVDRDVDALLTKVNSPYLAFPDIGLVIDIKEKRFLLAESYGQWQSMDDSAIAEYKPCKSLITSN